jgi:hypothetical protein
MTSGTPWASQESARIEKSTRLTPSNPSKSAQPAIPWQPLPLSHYWANTAISLKLTRQSPLRSTEGHTPAYANPTDTQIMAERKKQKRPRLAAIFTNP